MALEVFCCFGYLFYRKLETSCFSDLVRAWKWVVLTCVWLRWRRTRLGDGLCLNNVLLGGLLRIRETDSWPLDNIDVGGTVDSDRVSELDRCALYSFNRFPGCLVFALVLRCCIVFTIPSSQTWSE